MTEKENPVKIAYGVIDMTGLAVYRNAYEEKDGITRNKIMVLPKKLYENLRKWQLKKSMQVYVRARKGKFIPMYQGRVDRFVPTVQFTHAHDDEGNHVIVACAPDDKWNRKIGRSIALKRIKNAKALQGSKVGHWWFHHEEKV